MIGIDIVDVLRINRLLTVHGDRFLDKVFTEGEKRFSLARRSASESLAARFAAKEAFMKAQGRRLRWTDIEICADEQGKPFILFQGHRFEGVSLSHERSFAVAVVTV